MLVKGLIRVLEVFVKIGNGDLDARLLIGALIAIAVGCFGLGSHHVMQGKSPEQYLGMFLYAIVMPIFAGMVWWVEYRVPREQDAE